MDKYDHNAHSVFLLYYHLILVVKYRRKVFDDEISDRAKEIFCYIAPRYGITLEEWNHDEDHVHIMFRAQPKSEISKFINAYKSASSRLLKKEFPQIREKHRGHTSSGCTRTDSRRYCSTRRSAAAASCTTGCLQTRRRCMRRPGRRSA